MRRATINFVGINHLLRIGEMACGIFAYQHLFLFGLHLARSEIFAPYDVELVGRTLAFGVDVIALTSCSQGSTTMEELRKTYLGRETIRVVATCIGKLLSLDVTAR